MKQDTKQLLVRGLQVTAGVIVVGGSAYLIVRRNRRTAATLPSFGRDIPDWAQQRTPIAECGSGDDDSLFVG